MQITELEKLTKAQLVQLATENGVEVEGLSKPQLLLKLSEYFDSVEQGKDRVDDKVEDTSNDQSDVQDEQGIGQLQEKSDDQSTDQSEVQTKSNRALVSVVQLELAKRRTKVQLGTGSVSKTTGSKANVLAAEMSKRASKIGGCSNVVDKRTALIEELKARTVKVK